MPYHAVTLNDLRAAALYYDRVLPINVLELTKFPSTNAEDDYSAHKRVEEIYASHWNGLRENQHILRSVLFDDPEVSHYAVNDALDAIDNFVALAKYSYYNENHTAFLNANFILPRFHPEQQANLAIDLLDNRLLGDDSRFRDALSKLTSQLKLEKPSYLLPDFSKTRETGGQSPVYEVIFSSPDTVDYTKLSWDQVREVRRDPNAKVALRRFRTFLRHSYKDETQTEILDDISIKMTDYRSACKKHGLSLTQSWTSTFFKAEENTRRVGLLLLSSALDLNLLYAALAEGAASAASSFFEIKKARVERDDFIKQNPLTYVDPSYFWKAKPGAVIKSVYSVEKAYEGYLDRPIETKPEFMSVVEPNIGISNFISRGSTFTVKRGATTYAE